MRQDSYLQENIHEANSALNNTGPGNYYLVFTRAQYYYIIISYTILRNIIFHFNSLPRDEYFPVSFYDGTYGDRRI